MADLSNEAAERLGRAAYKAYTGLRTEQMQDGRVYPAWDDLELLERFAWEVAAVAAAEAERERIAHLAEKREAKYDLTKPCGCGRTDPRTGRPCTALVASGQPFADLIREVPGDGA
jgi:hypothetical protein